MAKFKGLDSGNKKLTALYDNLKEINKVLSNGFAGELKEYRDLCKITHGLLGELDVSISLKNKGEQLK